MNDDSVKSKPLKLWSNVFLSNWFFLWTLPIIGKANSNLSLKLELRPEEQAKANVDALEKAWKESSDKNFLNALTRIYGKEYALIGLYKIAWTFFTWAGAWYLMLKVLTFLNSPSQPILDGHMYALALFLSSLLSSIAIHQQYAECNRVGVKVKAAITGIVYRKSLRVSLLKGGAGEVINILSTDVTRINDAVVNLHFLWSAFVEVILILGISFYTIGIGALPALGFVLLLLPIQVYLGQRTNNINREQTSLTTQRVHLMSEILTAIKLIKFYAWESPFAEKIDSLREKEMKLIYEGMIVKTINFTIVFAIPVLVALSCFGTYIALGNVLTGAVSFTVLSVFNTLRYPFFMLPMAVKAYAGATIAIKRLEDFMKIDEVVELKISPSPKDSSLAFDIADADFKWDGTEGDKPSLSGISLSIPKGAKVAIVGDVGSGKSSLIAALLGQIRQTRGETVKLYGTTAYMSQEAWILNSTLRDNILFGRPMIKDIYKEVIRVAGLQRDLTLLLSGDSTELAERGANLSGGQRQRVSLARSVYYDADIVLLDDPLSAVDQSVGRHIFEECFMKHLNDKTLIVAINQLQYLSQMDFVVYMSNGIIKAKGTYQELMATDTSFSELVNNHVIEDEIEEQDDLDAAPMNNKTFDIPESAAVVSPVEKVTNVDEIMLQNGLSVRSRNQMSIRDFRSINEDTIRSAIEKNTSTDIPGARRNHDVAKIMQQNELSVYSIQATINQHDDDEQEAIRRGKLVQEDESTKGAGFGDFMAYGQAASGTAVTVGVVLLFIFVHAIRIGGDYWLRLWVPKTLGNRGDAFYIGIYGAFTFAFVCGVFARGLVFSNVTFAKAHALHGDIFKSVMHAPMSFFDMTPLGRILSAFSKHQLHVDDTMPDAALQALQYFPLGLGALILCSVLIPWNWAPSIGLVCMGYLLVRYSNAADMKTKSLESVTKPPIYAHFTATLEGLFSLRAYHAQDRFDAMSLQKIDTNHEALFAMQCIKSFQALYIDILSSFVIYFSTLLLVLNRSDPNTAANGGLALSNALQMLVFVQWTVRMWSDVETQMASVGQLVYYAKVKPEAPFEIPDKKPPSDWPQKGTIRFENIVLKYQKFGVSVLKNVSCTIYPTEKIGIVGRTGSGKSTLLVSLLRIVESAEGRILIDDLDVSTIGLHDLRNKVAIIPQEPVMFVGTLRSNLDPFHRSTDEEIWKALDAVQLGEKVRNMPSKLETLVTENGKSVSQGQRQLICIARAILSKAKILVLDEATASLDAQTDLLIQETIKKNFADLTMLTIAHRLNTIIECDRVLVMDAGKIVEFDEPIKLLDNKDGIFRSLVDQTGPASSAKLRECALNAHSHRVSNGYPVRDPQHDSSIPLSLTEIASKKQQ